MVNGGGLHAFEENQARLISQLRSHTPRKSRFRFQLRKWVKPRWFARGSELAREASIHTLTSMPMTIDQIVEETRSLPHDVVVDLVDRILLAAHGGQTPGHEQAWSATVHRRIAEIESGQAKLIPLDDALAQARQRIGR